MPKSDDLIMQPPASIRFTRLRLGIARSIGLNDLDQQILGVLPPGLG